MPRRAYMPARVSLVAISFLAPLGIAVGASSERDEPGFALEHVTILPMTNDGTPIEDAVVVVRSGRIAETGRSGRVQVPRRFTRLNGEGKWLMPGVADLHVHTLNRGYGLAARYAAMPEREAVHMWNKTECGALDVALDLAKRAISQPSRKPETPREASP